MLRDLRIVFISLLLVSNLVQAMEQPQSKVVDLSAVTQLDEWMPVLADKRVVFVGETHDRYDHHLNQLAIIEHQFRHSPELAIGLEFIQQPFQSVLDDYVAGTIDEAAMLRDTEYFDRWRFDFRLYRPIFSFARENGIRLLALNVDRAITDIVASGGVDALSPEQKQQLPAEIDRSNESYRQRLQEVFKYHPRQENDDFEKFLEVQLLWDEGMAERAARWLQANPEGRMVILAGSGHVMYGTGIPDRLLRRVDVSAASVINLDPQVGFEREMGDYAILSEAQTLPPTGKLGTMLDTTVSPPRVIGFTPGSSAKQAGLKQGDTLTAIAGIPIETYADIRIAMLDMPIDETVTVEVLRDGLFGGRKTRQFEITLK